jgi:hypothetical protein
MFPVLIPLRQRIALCIHAFYSGIVLSISIGQDHIKASASRFPRGKSPPFHQISLVIGSSRFRSWVGYTTSTEEWPEPFNSEAELPEESTY